MPQLKRAAYKVLNGMLCNVNVLLYCKYASVSCFVYTILYINLAYRS